MLYRPRTKRAGVSLLEVLTAIFIMGIGMLALLTLFPLGALSMARAVRADRAAHIAANAASLATVFDFRHDSAIAPDITAGTDANGPSNPVLIDPAMVMLVGATPALEYVGKTTTGSITPGVKRVAPVIVRNPTTATGTVTGSLVTKWFTFLDEIEFDTLGGARIRTSGTTNYVNRPGTYTWAYLMRRPRHSDENLAELTVIVYASRNTDNPDPDATFTVTSGGAQGSTSATIRWPAGASKPDLRKGTWVLDTSQNSKGFVNGYCYQVESATEVGPNQMTLEFDRPLKEAMTVVAELRYAVAVVERGTTWLP